MIDYDMINSRFSEPAAIISYKEGGIRFVDANRKFFAELWMDNPKEGDIDEIIREGLKGQSMRAYGRAMTRCAETGDDQEIETWRTVYSECCGTEKICIKSTLKLLEGDPGDALVYEAVRNITNERRTQETLADVEYRYEQSSEQLNIYNWEYNIETKEMRPCYRCMRDMGLPAVVSDYPEPVIDAGIFPADYADMYREMMRKIDEGAPEMEADIPLTAGRVPFRIKYTTEFDEDAKPVRAFGSATLISETELGHIRLDNEIIATLAEAFCCIYLADFVSDTVKVVKQEGPLSFDESSGCEGLAGFMASRLQDSADAQKELLGCARALREEAFRDCDMREFTYKDEQDGRWARVSYRVLERGSSKVDRLLVTVSVIDDLQAQKMDTDRLIASQKKELEDRQKLLLNAIDTANRANKAKTEFFSNMSHDIRTPMTAITGFSRLAMDEIENRELLVDYLDKISVAGDHLMSLINDILDMSRIESGKMELSVSPQNLKTLLNSCADMVRVKMDDHKLSFHLEVEEMGDDMVECDKLRFDQVILNLLSNAYKYTPEGGSVYLTGKLKERGDRLTYEIRVKDTGIGMSEEFCKHIWDAYSRENTQAVQEAQGTGLGMAIVRDIVNLMQGTIDLVSEPGKGSEFIIVLPLKPAQADTDEQLRDKTEEDALEKDYSGVTILVVDDASFNLKLAQRMLEKYGFTVKVTDSGVKALELLKSAKPGDIDMVLMDVMMPVMDGLETTKRIRAMEDPALSGITILAMTANAFEADIQETFDAGMDGHISKPYTQKELISTINAHLK